MNIILQKEMIVELPKGFTARGANFEDVEPALLVEILRNMPAQQRKGICEWQITSVTRTDSC